MNMIDINRLFSSIHAALTIQISATTSIYGDRLLCGVVFLAAVGVLGAIGGIFTRSPRLTAAAVFITVALFSALPLIIDFDWLDVAVIAVGLAIGMTAACLASVKGGTWPRKTAIGAAIVLSALLLIANRTVPGFCSAMANLALFHIVINEIEKIAARRRITYVSAYEGEDDGSCFGPCSGSCSGFGCGSGFGCSCRSSSCW